MSIVWEGKGNILEAYVQTLVCPVNTVGVMGKGLALQFKQRWPELLKAYREACQKHTFKHQGYFVYDSDDHYKIFCMPTKRHWREKSQLAWVEDGICALASDYEKLGITSIAIPAVGCGEGKLSWDNVRPIIWQYLDRLDIDVLVFEP
jgi:O-acetyl-ADP-ribose deacetylase (regulator of RNase III)